MSHGGQADAHIFLRKNKLLRNLQQRIKVKVKKAQGNVGSKESHSPYIEEGVVTPNPGFQSLALNTSSSTINQQDIWLT